VVIPTSNDVVAISILLPLQWGLLSSFAFIDKIGRSTHKRHAQFMYLMQAARHNSGVGEGGTKRKEDEDLQ
jgi:hypothetical protein